MNKYRKRKIEIREFEKKIKEVGFDIEKNSI